MIDIWMKLVSDQYKVAMDLSRAIFGIRGMETPAPAHEEPAAAKVSNQGDASTTSPGHEPAQEITTQEDPLQATVPDPEAQREAAQASGSDVGETLGRQIESQTGIAQAEAAPIPGIMSFLESTDRGATVREIAKHLDMDKKTVLPLLKTLVKERRIDELLGRYCVLKS